MLADHPAGWNKPGVYSGVKQNGIIDKAATGQLLSGNSKKTLDKN
jgi:hypothetical protein